MVINYCGLSGGKDSAATALWLIHESGVPRDSIRFTFCNTHNESPITYQHIHYLSDLFVVWGCAPIKWLEPKLGFYELAKKNKRFPARKARFCTQYLKVIPSREDVMKLIQAGHEVIVHSGVRAGESPGRAKLVERGFDDMFGCVVNRPILRWGLKEVFAIHERHGVRLNPLYAMGFTRVGCFPCMNSNKREIKLYSINFPDRVAFLREQEKAVTAENQNGHPASFFANNMTPRRFHSVRYVANNGIHGTTATIDDVVRWSHTGKGAKERSMMLWEDLYEDDKQLVCPSGAGMCE